MNFVIYLSLIFLLCLLVMTALLWVGGKQLIKRRPPDSSATPADFALTYEKVAFPSRYKAQLSGWWIPAPNPRGTLIFCHGQSGSMANDLPYAQFLNHAGYQVLLFDLRAHGESEGKYLTFGVFEKEDLLGAVDFLHQTKGIESLTVMGFSMGASVALIGGALSPHIHALILDGLYYKFSLVVERRLREKLPAPLAWMGAQLAVLGATFLTNTRMYQVSPILWARHLKGDKRVLLIHGTNDPYITPNEFEELLGDLQVPKTVWQAEGAGHREAFEKAPQTYQEKVLAWLAQSS